MTPQELLEGAIKGALILNPITASVALPYILREERKKGAAAQPARPAQSAKQPEKPKAPEAPEAPRAPGEDPGGYADPGTDYTPEQLPLPTGGVDLF